MKIASIFLTALLLSITVQPAQAANPTKITCKAPTTNADGTPLTDLASLKLYLGKTSGAYTVTTTAPHTIIGTDEVFLISGITGVTSGTWYVRCTATDTVGNESGYSTEISFAMDTVAPSTPSCSVN